MSEKRIYYRNFLTLLSGNTLSQAIPFLLAPLLTRLFAPEEFAIYSNYLAIGSMVGIVAAGRLELAIPISKETKGAQEVAFTGFVLTILLSIVSFVFPFFSEQFASFYKAPQLAPFLITIPLAVFSYGLLGLANNWVLRQKKYSAISFGKITQSLVNGGLAALLGYLGWGTTGLIVGWIASQFASIIVLAIFMSLKIKWKDYSIVTIKSTLKEHKDFPRINSLHAFTDIFATQFLLFWIISSEFGLLQLGFFTMMHRYVRQPIVLITSSVSQIFFAEASSAINEGRSPVPMMYRTIKTSMFFSLPFILVIFFFAPPLFSFFFGSNWYTSGEYARLIIPMLLVMFLVSPVSVIPILMNRQKTAYLIATFGYVFTLGSFYLATFLNWGFKDALLLYASCHALLQIVYLYWMYSILKPTHARID